MQGGDAAKQAYDVIAPTYDEFVHGYMYERWTARLLEEARAHGLEGKRLLDVGCGTGLSLISMVERGWEVTGCDISAEMLELARAKVSGRAELVVADMRELPVLGGFDLVWAVNNPFNYLLGVDELVATLSGMRGNLAPGGIVLFDLATLATFRGLFSEEHKVEADGRSLLWQGQAAAGDLLPGATAEASYEASGEPASAHVHRQRHFAEAEVTAAIGAAGLRCLGVSGELESDLHQPLDEERHNMAVYVCAAAR
ncbi:MAG TPA: class I SAM-dependent methyltransferase [Solirubrobacterales bacterium]|nr:class I SAM-dependent methyltransferase [Solirubrobacterales bacterium]